jgi:hypothetical protein
MLEDTSVENPDIYEISNVLTIHDRPTGDSVIFEIMNNRAVIQSAGPSFSEFRKELLVLVQTLGTKPVFQGSVSTIGKKEYSMKIGVILISTASNRIVRMTTKSARLVKELLHIQLGILEEDGIIGEYDLRYCHTAKQFILEYNMAVYHLTNEDIFRILYETDWDLVISMGHKERYVTLYMI